MSVDTGRRRSEHRDQASPNPPPCCALRCWGGVPGADLGMGGTEAPQCMGPGVAPRTRGPLRVIVGSLRAWEGTWGSP